MKKKATKIFSCLMAAVLTVLCLEIAGALLEPSSVIMCRANTRAFHRLPENSCDVIFYGSSISWRSIDPVQLYEDYGIGAYNYGANFQNLNTTALFFYDSIRTQKPKVAVFDLFRINRLTYRIPTNAEVYCTREIPGFSRKLEYLWAALGPHPLRYAIYMTPVFLFRDYWKDFRIVGYNAYHPPEDFLNTMGYCNPEYYEGKKTVTIPDPSQTEQKSLQDNTKTLLDEIIQTCREQGIEPLFITIPNGDGFACDDAMREYAEEKGCPFLNLYSYMEEIGLDTENDFVDEVHMNVNGAAKLTAFLGDYLSEHYDLQDMKLSQDNLWEGKEGSRIVPVHGLLPPARIW